MDRMGNRSPQHHNLLIIMARYPTRGKVKTRLAREIGHRAATDFYRSLLKQFARAFARTPYAVEWHFTPARAPFRRFLTSLHWPDPARSRPQPAGDLGTRMERIFADAFARGYGKVIMIGTDAPEINQRAIRLALNKLNRTAAVFQPTHDGGYALIGLREMIDVFTKIPWSTSQVMARTRNRLRQLGITHAELPTTYDIDTKLDFDQYMSK
jgi:hypothetical protein